MTASLPKRPGAKYDADDGYGAAAEDMESAAVNANVENQPAEAQPLLMAALVLASAVHELAIAQKAQTAFERERSERSRAEREQANQAKAEQAAERAAAKEAAAVPAGDEEKVAAYLEGRRSFASIDELSDDVFGVLPSDRSRAALTAFVKRLGWKWRKRSSGKPGAWTR